MAKSEIYVLSKIIDYRSTIMILSSLFISAQLLSEFQRIRTFSTPDPETVPAVIDNLGLQQLRNTFFYYYRVKGSEDGRRRWSSLVVQRQRYDSPQI